VITGPPTATLTWSEALKPAVDLHLVHAQVDVDLPRFASMFVELMSAPTPHADRRQSTNGGLVAGIASR